MRIWSQPKRISIGIFNTLHLRAASSKRWCRPRLNWTSRAISEEQLLTCVFDRQGCRCTGVDTDFARFVGRVYFRHRYGFNLEVFQAVNSNSIARCDRGVLCVRRHLLAITVLIISLLSRAGISSDAVAQVSPGYSIEMSRMIPMRDGVELEAWIFKPENLHGKAPAVLSLNQYEIDGISHGSYFAKRGFVYLQVYVRGRGRSGGVKEDNLGLQVGRDGYDVVEWIAAQPWSDGRVVMYGASFFGMTQWRTAAQHPPHLAAIAPYVPIYPGWDVPNTTASRKPLQTSFSATHRAARLIRSSLRVPTIGREK